MVACIKKWSKSQKREGRLCLKNKEKKCFFRLRVHTFEKCASALHTFEKFEFLQNNLFFSIVLLPTGSDSVSLFFSLKGMTVLVRLLPTTLFYPPSESNLVFSETNSFLKGDFFSANRCAFHSLSGTKRNEPLPMGLLPPASLPSGEWNQGGGR